MSKDKEMIEALEAENRYLEQDIKKLKQVNKTLLLQLESLQSTASFLAGLK